GRDLLWKAEPHWWERTSPLLFPAVGWRRNGRYTIAGKQYAMGVHGFAAASMFEVVCVEEGRAHFRLHESAESLAAFPFTFVFDVIYTLRETELEIALEISNTGDGVMPYACGLHPGFAWPFAGRAREHYSVRFEKDELPFVPVIAPGGLFSQRRRAIDLRERRLMLNDEIFEQEAMCFLNARSSALAFCAPDGEEIILHAQGFAHLAVWSKPGAPFVSLECWTGHGDPEDFAGDLHAVPSMILLEPGARRGHRAIFEYTCPRR
ncbi:MAG: aldose 1-epimerase family protein, partial [Alphaproteobacteria bacterium]|nr:aldose 1-epimerase family protein [Alphaproteobacteria bacterium]